MAVVRGLVQLRRDDVAVAGGKAANLGELVAAGFPVPPGYVITTGAYRWFVEEAGIGERVLALATVPSADAARRIQDLFVGSAVPADLAAEILGPWDGSPVAVRSSATAEDLADASFAGQQDTFLNVATPDALVGAVRDCWASLWTERARTYRARQGIAPADVALAVVVQQMVEADAAGVLFTANPADGRRDEIAISAAWGLGEAVVSGSVTTDDLVVARDGTLLSRTTADKAVMTVYAETGTREQPVEAALRRAPVLDIAAAAELARLGVAIEEHFGAPQDVEWARSGGRFWIVQARPITALPELTGPVPTTWPVPDTDALYVRASIVEQLPDPLSPLFAALIDPAVTRSLTKLFGDALGRDLIGDDGVGLPTVNGYAYYRYGRAAMYRMLLHTPQALRLLTSGRLGVAHWRDRARPGYAALVASWAGRPWAGLPDGELLDAVVELLQGGSDYYTAVQAIIPIAASGELAFTRFHEGLVRRAADPPASTFLLGFDSSPILAEKSLHAIATTTAPGSPEEDARFAEHLARWGHTVYNLDFRNAVPADDPAPLLAALAFHRDGRAGDPNVRQAASAARRTALTDEVCARLDPVRRSVFRRLLAWAQATTPVREDALADIGLAWPLLRRMLAELGRRRVDDGTLAAAEDVFWLLPDEVAGHAGVPNGAVERRRALWRGQRLATPPQSLPVGSWMDRLEAIMPAASLQQTGPVVRGTGASAGRVTAIARVLSGPGDFARLQPGEVLVTGITTPAWTPLFGRAAAVVTDIGDPLSHSSIVAREYGIPAVLGTGVATRRIVDGSRVLVDGDAGTVTLLDEVTAEEETAAAPHPSGRRRRALLVAGGIACVLVVAVGRAHRTAPPS